MDSRKHVLEVWLLNHGFLFLFQEIFKSQETAWNHNLFQGINLGTYLLKCSFLVQSQVILSKGSGCYNVCFFFPFSFEVYLKCKNMHIFNVYILMSTTYAYTHEYHHHNQGDKHIHHFQKMCPFSYVCVKNTQNEIYFKFLSVEHQIINCNYRLYSRSVEYIDV